VLFEKIGYFEKYIYILAFEIASPWNQHCANCIGTLSFPIINSLCNKACGATNADKQSSIMYEAASTMYKTASNIDNIIIKTIKT